MNQALHARYHLGEHVHFSAGVGVYPPYSLRSIYELARVCGELLPFVFVSCAEYESQKQEEKEVRKKIKEEDQKENGKEEIQKTQNFSKKESPV